MLARQAIYPWAKLKAAFFHSYVEYRLNTNISSILKNMSHLGEVKEEVKKVTMVDGLSIQE
jgi:hypothetical protein